jgi:monoterpene epsilon-lactone hydrolase
MTTRYLARSFPVIVVGLALTLLWLGIAVADEGVWIVGPRKIPPPLGASAELRQSIAATSQPDVKAVSDISPATASDWTKIAGPRDKTAEDANRELAEKWSVQVVAKTVAGVPVFEVTPAKLDPTLADKLFVHTHGGAFVFNRGWAGLREAILIAHHVGIPVLSIDYRMPPEAPYPAAIEDVVAVWRELVSQRKASSMAIGGTSAGGNLAIASVLRLKELKLPLPAAVIASTPWADLDKTGDSYFTNEGIDRNLVTYEGMLAAAAKLYANGRDLKEPLISPVYGDFIGFPPSLLFTGTRDLFLSGTVRTHRNMRAAGVDAELYVFEAMSHGGWTNPEFPESHTFTNEIAIFLKRQTE